MSMVSLVREVAPDATELLGCLEEFETEYRRLSQAISKCDQSEAHAEAILRSIPDPATAPGLAFDALQPDAARLKRAGRLITRLNQQQTERLGILWGRFVRILASMLNAPGGERHYWILEAMKGHIPPVQLRLLRNLSPLARQRLS